MSRVKDIIAEKEENKHNQTEGYRKKLLVEGTYNMDCPYCCNALSDYDITKEQCIHCGHILKWNEE